MRQRSFPYAGLLTLLTLPGLTFAEDAEPPGTLPTVTVIAPLLGPEMSNLKLPYFIQSSDADALSRSHSLGLADFMNSQLAGVTLNHAQNNPLQPDLQFRGFTATPLLGGSEGISVYVDGVRVNEVFGDTVNWDLIPDAAIARMDVLSGANPVFGLNTLGGALALQTQTGFSQPGTRAQYYTGDFGRQEAILQTGGHGSEWGWYLMGRNFDEDGWRDFSPSRAANLYGTLSWHRDHAKVGLHAGRGNSKLVGNGSAPVEELAQRRTSIFTAPDETQNKLSVVSLQGSFDLAATRTLSASIYHRKVNTGSYNGDSTDSEECATDDDLLCDDDGEPILDQNGEPVSSDFDAINNISHRRQTSNGGTAQLSISDPVGGFDNQLVVGAEHIRGRLRFDSAVEASFLQDNLVTARDTGVFIPAADLLVRSRTSSTGVYFTDTLSLSNRLAVTVSGRWNRIRTKIDDLTGENPDLNGRHRFSRFNPAAGATYQLTSAINLYGGYSESTRAPTPVELTCSDEDAPCRLPNQFLADPPLDQVVAHSWELGLRGTFGQEDTSRVTWHAGAFTTTNTDDILFQTTGGASSNEGFFANVGDTRRRGFEASLRGRLLEGRLHTSASYTYLDATYRTSFLEVSANHPDADDEGIIAVNRGDRIPSLPKHGLKLAADYQLTQSLSIGGDLVSNSGQYLRSDEANLLGKIGGFTVMNLRAEVVLAKQVELFGRIDNVFDRRYETFGALGEPEEVLPQFADPRFLSPAPPRAAWVGVRINL